MNKAKKEPRGEYLSVRVSELALRRLDGLRKQEDDLPNRAEMVRRLIERAPFDGEMKVKQERASA